MSEIPGRLAQALADRYRLERELGQGGMATVYLAEDLKHDRPVAIKVLKPDLAAVLGAERFITEIKTTAALSHPHILPLFDSGEAGGFLYYVMPYIQGETIRERLDRETQLGVEDAVRIASEVADALDYAHRHGVIHRDIKPENILLHDGRAMVMDFGIALAVSAAAGGRMTETGLSLGTPHYMSPEQATAEKQLTARSDVYSLGSVLYEMLSGEPPHLGNSAQAIIMKIVTEDAQPVTRLRKAVPPHVAAAVAKALERLPADRFESAGALRQALANPGFTALAAGPAAGTGRGAARDRRTLRLMTAVAALAVVAAAWGWLRPVTGPVPARASWRTTLQLRDTPATVARETYLSLSRDGSLLVFSGGWGPTQGLYLRRAGDEHVTLIRGTEGAQVGAISPNGELVAFKASRGMLVVPLRGGIPRLVAPAELISRFEWSDDDTLLLDQIDGIYRVPLTGGEMVRLTTVDTAAGEGYHVAPAALPGGGVVFTIHPASSLGAADARIAAVGPDGGMPTLIGQGVTAAYAPPGYLLIRTGTGSVDALPFNPVTRQVTGPRQTLIDGLTAGLWNSSGELAVAEDGRLVYVTDPFEGDREILAVSRGGATRPLAGGWIGNFETVSVSPDGQRLAVGTYTASHEEIQVRHLVSGATTRLSLAGVQLRHPAWAPSGNTLYFSGLGTGKRGIYRIEIGAGMTAERVVSHRDRTLDWPAPSADGRRVYFTMRGGDDLVAWEVGQPESTAVVLEQTTEREFAPVPSPNHRWLAFRSSEAGLMVRSSDPTRSERIVVFRGGVTGAPRWSRDGTELFFATADSLMAVQVGTGAEFTMGTPGALFALGRRLPYFDVHPNGEFVMLQHLAARPNPPSLILLEDWKALVSR